MHVKIPFSKYVIDELEKVLPHQHEIINNASEMRQTRYILR